MHTLADPFYYLTNFQTALGWISDRYQDLLACEERVFIRDFGDMPRPSQALAVRMLMRKGEIFRLSRLRYSEIGPIQPAAEPLLEKGWVDGSPELSLEQLFQLLTKTEIRACFQQPLADLSVRRDARKADLLEALRPVLAGTHRFDQWWADTSDQVLSLRLTDLCQRFQLMFFGNLRQDWSEFALSDLGIYQYETVAFSTASRAFQARADIDAYLELHRCRQRLEAGAEPVREIACDIPGPFHANPWLESRRSRLLFQIGRQCERQREPAMALELYQRSGHPEARIRRLRVLEQTGQLAAALELAQRARQAPASEAESQHLQRLLPRLQRKLDLPVGSRPRAAPAPRLDLTLPRPDPPFSVEEVTARYLGQPEAPAYYVENALVNSLFGLLCWEPVFAPLPGAFFHPFHHGPADLLQPDFHARRADRFERCLEQLESGLYRSTIRHNFAAKYGLQSPFVYWGGISAELLELALHCIPAAHLRKWFERLLLDIRQHRAGMPDLIQFWPAEQRYRMVEVKGPGDRLQDNQRRWLDFCAGHDMPATVCHVQWADPDGHRGP